MTMIDLPFSLIRNTGFSGLSLPEPKTTDRKVRVAVFGSFLGGRALIQALRTEPISRLVSLVGIATDDPRQPFTHPNVRLWKYPHTREDELIVRMLAEREGVPLWTGKVIGPDFLLMFSESWAPDLCLMATFGQKIPKSIFSLPPLGFYNFHHSDSSWPSYAGPDPIAAMLRDGKTTVYLTMHEVSELLDGGRFVARSDPMPLPQGINAIELHRTTWPKVAGFLENVILQLIGPNKRNLRKNNLLCSCNLATMPG
jgi:methionyl-tRNA formyltransferase